MEKNLVIDFARVFFMSYDEGTLFMLFESGFPVYLKMPQAMADEAFEEWWAARYEDEDETDEDDDEGDFDWGSRFSNN